ncbi:MAG: heparan-alpha-glucosaminide N-acetyltransferase domain-containing protein [Desulfobulbaceae bacterium]|jgi:predicted acyltransferase|nr:heparan-alpha-glucosaminide N-acetyltransferase domain-containing protein [Desulfobulbaceae bacterium]
MKATNQRILALDIFRGITIAGMILVNNPGSWESIYPPLAHAPWNGLTPTDLVFPFFMFIMGISTYISLKKYDFNQNHAVIWKIIKRTLVIFAIGLGIAWFSLFFQTWNSLVHADISVWSRLWQASWTFDHIRIFGVLQRLALSYCGAAFVAILVKHKHIPWLIAGLLLFYSSILLFCHGFEYNESNILSIVDRAVLGLNHIYEDNGIDPEGILSTIPAIAHVLIGFYCGKLMIEGKDINEKIQRLFLAGTILTFTGFLLGFACPINKKIWSPTFTIATCGLASCFLALLIWIIDIKGKKTWSRFFESFGINPLFMYVTGTVFAISLENIKITGGEERGICLQEYIYENLLQPALGDYPSSLVYALLFVLLVWMVGYILCKKEIYI